MSTLAVNTITPANAGSETYFLTKAWVNFNGTGTVAIRAGGNVSSITDAGTGIYNVNFSTPISDANYSVSLTTNFQTGGIPVIDSTTPQIYTTYFRIYNDRYGSGTYDAAYFGANVVR